MSLAKPVYSKNPFLHAIEDVGHVVHEGEHVVVGVVVHSVRDVLVIASEFKKQLPTVLADNAAVIEAAGAPELLALDAALGIALASGVNPVLWWAVLVCLLKAAPAIAALIAKVKILATTLGVDVSGDIESLK